MCSTWGSTWSWLANIAVAGVHVSPHRFGPAVAQKLVVLKDCLLMLRAGTGIWCQGAGHQLRFTNALLDPFQNGAQIQPCVCFGPLPRFGSFPTKGLHNSLPRPKSLARCRIVKSCSIAYGHQSKIATRRDESNSLFDLSICKPTDSSDAPPVPRSTAQRRFGILQP